MAEPRTEGDSAPAVQALSVLLKQHELFQEEEELPTLLTLLGCSSAVRSIVHAEFRGRLHVTMPCKQQQTRAGQHANSYRLWLAKHASLLHTLSFTLSGSADEAAIAAGLKAAAAGAATGDLAPAGEAAAAAAAVAPPSLPLASLQCCSPISGELLAAVASVSKPTSLQLTLEGGSMDERPALSAALASLTSLQHLRLDSAATAYVSELGSGLSSLTGLTELHCSNKVLLQPADVGLLPTSLQVLSISSRTNSDGRRVVIRACDDDPERAPDPREWMGKVATIQALDLTPLSALTRLDIRSLTSRDKLPPNLQELRLTTPHSFAPVKHCSSLHTLSIRDQQCQTPWQELKRVSIAHKGLQTVSVELGNPFDSSYGGGEFMPWPTWDLHHTGNALAGVKQLKKLFVSSYFLLPSFVKGLSRCSQLTHLALRNCTPCQKKDDDLTWGCTDWTKKEVTSLMRSFSGCLKKLSHLQHLELQLDLTEMRDNDDKDPNWSITNDVLQPLVQAGLGMPGLERLYVRGGSGPALVDRKS